MQHPRQRPRKSSGFTLIEMIAIVALVALIFGIGLPSLSRRSFDPLEDEAEQIAQRLRFARQRAIVTGVPHRLLLDLEEGGYLVEWFVTEERAAGGAGDDADSDPSSLALLFSGGTEERSLADGPAIDFHPRRTSDRDYYPIPSREMGSLRWLEDSLYFVGIEGPGGWVESGDFAIVFQADGTTDPLLLELADGQDHHLTLEIEALLEQVRIREGGARS